MGAAIDRLYNIYVTSSIVLYCNQLTPFTVTCLLIVCV
jgi:hypothetical protein